MSYADAQYYTEVYQGNIIPAEELEQALARASDQIDCMTFNRILAAGFESLTSFQQATIKKAVCAHADFIAQYGEFGDLPLSGFSAGDVSLSLADTKVNGITTSRAVVSYLGQTGLSSRRI